MSKKKRLELRFDPIKDKDVVHFLENEVDNQAGFIKQLVRDYVRFNNQLQVSDNTYKEESNNETQKLPPSESNNKRSTNSFLNKFAISSNEVENKQ